MAFDFATLGLLFDFPCQFLGRKYSSALNRVLSAAPAH